MISLLSVRPSCAASKPGPPGVVASAGAPKSIARSGRGAGAAGAATDVSPEKSMRRPPKAGNPPAAPTAASFFVIAGGVAADAPSAVAASAVAPVPFPSPAEVPFARRLTALGLVCLPIDASLPRLDTPGGYRFRPTRPQ